MALITTRHSFGMWDVEGSAVKMNEMFDQLAFAAQAQQAQRSASTMMSVDLLNQLAQYAGPPIYGRSVFGGGQLGVPGLQGVAPSHFGQVRQMRKKFKEVSKEEFRHLSKEPVVKHILMGATKLDKEQIAERIKEHIEAV